MEEGVGCLGGNRQRACASASGFVHSTHTHTQRGFGKMLGTLVGSLCGAPIKGMRVATLNPRAYLMGALVLRIREYDFEHSIFLQKCETAVARNPWLHLPETIGTLPPPIDGESNGNEHGTRDGNSGLWFRVAKEFNSSYYIIPPLWRIKRQVKWKLENREI